MNQREAKRFTYQFTIDSLRRKAPHVTTGLIGGSAKQGDVTKVREQMLALAEMLDKKLAKRKRTNEPEAGPPSAVEGAHDIPEVGGVAEPGHAPASER